MTRDATGAAIARECGTCMWWAQDDDGGDEEATCVEGLNDPAERNWRTKRTFVCRHWRHGATP